MTTIETTDADAAMHHDRVLFLHLPKTAGTALRTLFAKQLGDDRVTRGLATMPLSQALIRYAEFDVICGHFHPDYGMQLPTDRLTMTVLRDPIDRFLSQYYFSKFDVQTGMIDQRVRGMDLDAFIDALSERELRELNEQTFMLYPLGADLTESLAWPERINAAERALDAFDYVGTHDEIEDFVAMISARLGWPVGTKLERVNVSSRRDHVETMSAASREKLGDLLKYDRAIYDYARTRFRQLRRAAIAGHAVRAIAPRAPADAPARTATTPTTPREFGDRRLEMTRVSVSGAISGIGQCMVGEHLTLGVDFVAHTSMPNVSVAFVIRDERGLAVYGTNNWLLGETVSVEPGTYRASFAFICRIAYGRYAIDTRLICNGSHFQACYHWKEQAAFLDVYGRATPYFEGSVMMDPSTHFSKLSPRGDITVVAADVDRSRPALTIGRQNPRLGDYSARITPLQTLTRVATGTELLVDLDLVNTSTETWRADGKQPVCVSYHWHDRDGSVVEYDGIRTRLPRDIAPGEHVRVIGIVRAPQLTGAMRLTWTLVQEGVDWFDRCNRDACVTMDVDIG